MEYPRRGDGSHSLPWNVSRKRRKTISAIRNSAAGRRAFVAAEEAERYNIAVGRYPAPPPPVVEVVIASNPFDDSHAPPPRHLPRQLLAAPPQAPPPEYPYGFAPREQATRARPPQGRGRGRPKSQGQPPSYPGARGPIINTKSRMLMGGGNVNVQRPQQQPGVNGPSTPLPPAQVPYCPPMVWGHDDQAHYQPAISELDPCYMDGLPYDPAAPVLRGQLAPPTVQAPEPQRSPQLLDECGARCGEFVCSSEEPIWCRVGCGLVYHRRCTLLTPTAYYLLINTPNAAWLCETCEKNKPGIVLVKAG